MSVMKYLLVSCAALLVGLFMNVSLADAFSTQTINNSNPDGTARFVDPDGQTPGQRLDEGASGSSAYVLKLPSIGRTADMPQSDDAVQGSTFDPEENRLVFGPFNHFGYGSSNQ